MILAAVIDLMFASRIRTAASSAGTEVQFVRTADQVVEQAAARHPSLILIDLNAAPLDPLAVVARLKGHPELRAIRVVGFVSHVQAELIAAARAAGVDSVLARSAFVARLPELLA